MNIEQSYLLTVIYPAVLCNRLTIERQLMELRPVHSSDAGVYECCAMNDVGMACTNFTLAVNIGIYQYLLLSNVSFCVIYCN